MHPPVDHQLSVARFDPWLMVDISGCQSLEPNLEAVRAKQLGSAGAGPSIFDTTCSDNGSAWVTMVFYGS